MAALRNYTLKVKAGEVFEFGLRGSMVRVVSASCAIYFSSRDDNANFYLVEGEQVELKEGIIFKQLDISHKEATEQTIILAVGENAVIGSAKVSGSVVISNTAGTSTQGRASVTNVNQVLIAAKANRRYLLIQNNDSGAVLRVTLDGNAATAAEGFRVQAGGTLEIPNYQGNSAINCIMETASAVANNVEFLEA